MTYYDKVIHVKNYYVSKELYNAYYEFGMQQGIETNAIDITQVAGLQTIDISVFNTLITKIVNHTKDPYIGIKLGKSTNMAALGVVINLIQHSKNLKIAVEIAIQNFNLISNIVELKKTNPSNKNEFSLSLEWETSLMQSYPLIVQNLTLSSMIFIHFEIYYLTGKSVLPKRASTLFDLSKYQRSLPFKLEKHKQTELIYNENLLDWEIISSEYHKFIALEKVVCQQLKKLTSPDIISNVKNVVLKLSDPDFPKINSVADQLNLTERTLQRKLKRLNVSYSSIIMELKKEMSVEYLRFGLKAKDISLLLGFSEPSAFTRAFKSWYKIPPKNHELIQSKK